MLNPSGDTDVAKRGNVRSSNPDSLCFSPSSRLMVHGQLVRSGAAEQRYPEYGPPDHAGEIQLRLTRSATS